MKVLALAAACLGLGDVRELDDSNFESIIGTTNVLVEFYEPECGHCETMEPDFYVAASTLEFEEDIVFVRVDTAESPELKKRFEIEGHPVFKWFPKGSTEGEAFYFVHYSGRMATTFLRMIGERLGREFPEVPMEPTRVRTLKAEDWPLAHPFFVVFYTPWTENKNVAEALEKTAKLFDLPIAKMPIERKFERDLAENYDCRRYPCYFLFADDKVAFDGPYDDVRAYTKFLNHHLGLGVDYTTLDVRAHFGRIAVFDKLIAEPYRTQRLRTEFPTIPADQADSAHYYIKVAAKIDELGDDYLAPEIDRLADLLRKPGISARKRKEFAARKNILHAFLRVAQPHDSPRSDL